MVERRHGAQWSLSQTASAVQNKSDQRLFRRSDLYSRSIFVRIAE
jgi:hypothetical protein